MKDDKASEAVHRALLAPAMFPARSRGSEPSFGQCRDAIAVDDREVVIPHMGRLGGRGIW